MSCIIVFAGPQKLSTLPLPSGAGTFSGLISFMMHTASIVSTTPAGGTFMPFTSSMSAFLSVARALTAASSAGSASARPASQSALMALAFAATTSAAALSFETISLTLAASFESASILIMSASASLRATTSCGWSACNSCCMPATDAAVSESFCRPTSYRDLAAATSERLTSRSALNEASSSR